MKSRDFGVVGLKIFAIYLFTQGVNYLLASINFWSVYASRPDFTPAVFVYVSFLTAVFYLGIALILWKFAGKIVRYILPENNGGPDEKGKEKIALEDLKKAAFTVVGVVIISNAIPNLFHAAAQLIRQGTFLMEDILNLIGHFVYLGIGIFLLYRVKDIVKFLSSGGKGILKFGKSLRRE